jgi:hypothetical protein
MYTRTYRVLVVVVVYVGVLKVDRKWYEWMWMWMYVLNVDGRDDSEREGVGMPFEETAGGQAGRKITAESKNHTEIPR